MKNQNFVYGGWKANGFVALACELLLLAGFIVLIVLGALRADASLPGGVAMVVAGSVGLAAVTMAFSVGAKAILTPTTSGRSARLVSNFRPALPIIAVTHKPWAQRRMTVVWGVEPVLDKGACGDVAYVVDNAMRIAEDTGVIKEGDIAVITVGDPHTSVILPDGLYSTNVVYVSQVRAEGSVVRETY